MYCSPNSANFILAAPLNQKDNVHICGSFCDSIYSACGDAVIVGSNGQTVKTAYQNGAEFCNSDAWFTPFHTTVVASGTSNCFDSGKNG